MILMTQENKHQYQRQQINQEKKIEYKLNVFDLITSEE